MEPIDDREEPLAELDEVYERFCAQLLQWREACRLGHIYVLLDPNHPVPPYDPLHLDRLARRAVSRQTVPVPRPDLAHTPKRLPRLVQLYAAGENGYVDEPLLELTFLHARECCRNPNGAYVAGWLLTEASPDELARHLAEAGVMFDMRLGKERFLPFFEPHRFALQADSSPGADLLQRWLGPIEQWMLMDRSDSLRSFQRQQRAAADRPRGAAVLNRDQSAAQERVAMARLVLLGLEKAGVALTSTPEHRVDLAVRRAQGFGLRHTEDIVFCALNDFTLGMGWSEHPRVAPLFERVAGDPGLGLAAEVTALPDDVLAEIVRQGHNT